MSRRKHVTRSKDLPPTRMSLTSSSWPMPITREEAARISRGSGRNTRAFDEGDRGTLRPVRRNGEEVCGADTDDTAAHDDNVLWGACGGVG